MDLSSIASQGVVAQQAFSAGSSSILGLKLANDAAQQIANMVQQQSDSIANGLTTSGSRGRNVNAVA